MNIKNFYGLNQTYLKFNNAKQGVIKTMYNILKNIKNKRKRGQKSNER